MKPQPVINRRDFLKISAVAGVGLVISVYLSGCGEQPTETPGPPRVPTDTMEPTLSPSETPSPTSTPVPTPEIPAWVTPTVYLTIGNDGLVKVTVPRSELGQGIRTALAMIAAEELCADWSTVRVEQAPGDSIYGNQTTGGSTSIQDFYDTMRMAGAVGRELMVRAAAQAWGVNKEECSVENNTVFHQPTGKQLAYWELIDVAATLKVPRSDEVTFVDAKDFKIIGKPIRRIDNPQIVTGKAIYGLDVQIPGMLYAAVARCPVFFGKPASFNDVNALKVPGVRQVVQINGGVAVVAEDTWSAMQGRKALEVNWDEGKKSSLSSAQIEKDLMTQATAIPGGEGELTAFYVMPFYSHATMEPMNCTADVRADGCEVWVPTQDPQAVLWRVASLTGLTKEKVRVNVTLVGGAFGRRLENTDSGEMPPEADYVSQAVQVSKAAAAPVKVVWTREDDIQHDLYHPLSVTRVSAKLDNIKPITVRRFGASGVVPTGYWRSVTNPPEAFARESFLDEFAATTKVDPLELRRNILSERAMAVVDLAAEKAGWGTPLPEGHGRGIAYHATWGVTHVAQVAEVSVDQAGKVRVQRVVCAVDCGLVINPDIVTQQMEGGIVFGLTSTLKENITIENGRTMQSNFHDYPLLHFDERPAIEVYIVPSDKQPTGVGEMANPPLAPAVANAIFAATGKRIRRLPIRAEDLR